MLRGRHTRQIRPTRQPERFQTWSGGVAQRRVNGVLTPAEQSIREEILNGLITDKGGEARISTAMRVLAEVIASDAAWLVAVNRAIDGVMDSNQKARNNPKALHTLDGYKRGVVNSLAENLQRFGFEKAAKAETLQDIIEEMGEGGDEGIPTGNT